MKLIKLLSFFLLISLCTYGQTNSKTRKNFIDTTQVDVLNLKIAYYGIITFNPGIKAGIEYPLRRKVKQRIYTFKDPKKATKIKTVRKDYIGSLNAGFYNHKKNHTGIFLNADVARRRTGNRGGFYEYALGLGVLKTFQAPTYVIDDSNNTDKVFLPGHLFYTAQFSFAYGRDYTVKGKPWRWYIRPNYYLIFPYNNLFSANFGMEIGIAYKLIKNPLNKK
jgi:hypothetical protein